MHVDHYHCHHDLPVISEQFCEAEETLICAIVLVKNKMAIE